jgi:hypothetical protein
MQNDTPSRQGGVTEPNESDEFRQRLERQVRRWRLATRVIDILTLLAIAAIVAVILKMIFF